MEHPIKMDDLGKSGRPIGRQEILQFFSAWPAAERERVGGLLSSCSKGDVQQKADDSVRETW